MIARRSGTQFDVILPLEGTTPDVFLVAANFATEPEVIALKLSAESPIRPALAPVRLRRCRLKERTDFRSMGT